MIQIHTFRPERCIQPVKMELGRNDKYFENRDFANKVQSSVYPGSEIVLSSVPVQIASSETGILAVAHLVGPFRIVTIDGTDATPKGQIRRALLAVLLTSPDQMRSRQYLADLFWATSGNKKSAASLRTALTELRKEMETLGADFIQADRYLVRLAVGRVNLIWTRRPNGKTGQFLEGLDLSLRGAEVFEEWLRDMRQNNPAEPAETEAAPDPGPRASLLRADRLGHGSSDSIALALLPCRVTPANGQVEIAANLVIDQMLNLVGQLIPLRLYDYRDNFHGAPQSESRLIHGNGPRLILEPRAIAAKDCVVMRLIDSRSSEILWTGELQGTQGAKIDSDLMRLVESLIAFLVRLPECSEEEILSPYQALVAMFHLQSSHFDRLQAMIDAAIGQSRRPVDHALNCYLATVRVGENLGAYSLRVPRDLRDAAREAVQPGSFHAYSLSMAGYALTYLAGEIDLGLDMTSRAVELAPQQAFCWDQLALCLFTAGDFDAAAAATRSAQTLGAHSPIRYTNDTTAAIVAFARGDYPSTVRFGNRALFRMPRFTAALRYTAAALGHLDQLGDSRRLVHQLRRVNPSASLGGTAEARHLPRGNDIASRLTSGLKRAGLR
jgi:hypothetical protein